MQNKNKLSGIIFARVLATIGIIIFHYFCHSNCHNSFLYQTANAEFGFLWVTCFFAISGVVLYYNYSDNFSLKTFYFKRWKAIFPVFYLCWFFWFSVKVFSYKELFWAGNPLKLIFTLFGIDGYFYYRIFTYCTVGEWFLGALIFVYILYPFLRCCINKNVFIVPLILFFGYVLQFSTDFFIIDSSRNLFTCIASFYFGMIVIKYKNLFVENKSVALISLILFLYLCFIKIKMPCIEQIQGCLVFIILIQTGKYIMDTPLRYIFNSLDKITFPMFLFQHEVILNTFKFYNPSDTKETLSTLIFVILVTIICAKIVSVIINFIFKTKIFKKIESNFL